MDVRQFMPSSTYLRAADLQGQSITATITSVNEETVGFGAQAEQKAVLHYSGSEKGLVLNVINSNTISDLLGFESQNWVGKAITMYPATTDFGGKIVDCIRVKMPPTTPVAPLMSPTASAPTPSPAPVTSTPVFEPTSAADPVAAPQALPATQTNTPEPAKVPANNPPTDPEPPF